MKRISNRTQRHFMAAIVSRSRELNKRALRLQTEHFDALRKRDDFNSVLSLLEGKGYIQVKRADNGTAFTLHLTDLGYCFFENSDAALSDRRWTRGLAIAAIIISLLALALQFFDSELFKTIIGS